MIPYQVLYHFFDGFTFVYDSMILSSFNPYNLNEGIDYISQLLKIDSNNIFIDNYSPLINFSL